MRNTKREAYAKKMPIFGAYYCSTKCVFLNYKKQKKAKILFAFFNMFLLIPEFEIRNSESEIISPRLQLSSRESPLHELYLGRSFLFRFDLQV